VKRSNLERNTKERLLKYATASLEARARKEVQRLNPQPQPSPRG
jgi:hypothetical protein